MFLFVDPGQGNELPEQPFEAVDRVIHFVEGRLARRGLRAQTPHQIEMRPQDRQRRPHLMGSVGGESAYQFDRQIQTLQQRVDRNRRREGFLWHPRQIERTEIRATLDTPRVDFLLEFAKWPQPPLDRVPAEQGDQANQSGLENRKAGKHLVLDRPARLHGLGDGDEDQARPAVNLPRLRRDTNWIATVFAVMMTGITGLQAIEPGERKILVSGDQLAEIGHAVIDAVVGLTLQHAQGNLWQIDRQLTVFDPDAFGDGQHRSVEQPVMGRLNDPVDQRHTAKSKHNRENDRGRHQIRQERSSQ